MSDLDDLARRVEALDLPDGPPLAEIRRRVRARHRRRTMVGAATACVVVVAAVAASLGQRSESEIHTVAPPDYDAQRFDPAPGTAATWEWRATPAVRSRTGEGSGYGVRIVSGSTDLLLVLDDGGVCVDAATCATSRTSFDEADLERHYVRSDGGPVRSLVGPDGPMSGWNVVVVPGITGDLHAGRKRGVDVPDGPAGQDFVGSVNLERVLAGVVADDALAETTRVVVFGTGSSGLAAVMAVPAVHTALGDRLAGVVADGGAIPHLSGVLPACVLSGWSQQFGLAYPDDWFDIVADDQPTSLSGMYEYIAGAYPDVEAVQLTGSDDAAVGSLLRAGAHQCESPPGDPRPNAVRRGIERLDDHLEAIGWTSVVVAGDTPAPLAATSRLASAPALERALVAIVTD